MRQVFSLLLGLVALAAVAAAAIRADEASPPMTAGTAPAASASAAPDVTPRSPSAVDARETRSLTTSGQVQDGTMQGCYCASHNGQPRCLRNAFCNESPLCQNGNCPPGMACWVDSCCGVPTCVPDDCIQDPDCRAPGVCSEFDECSQIPINYCEMVAKKVKRKNCDQCPSLPPQKSGDDCDPPGPNPDKCTPGDKIKGKMKRPCPGNPRGSCIYKNFQLNGNCAP